MADVIFVLAVVGVTIYAVIDCWRSDDAEIRGLPKPLWFLVIVALAPLGGLAWIFLGHDPGLGSPRAGRRRQTVPPDDDAEFLRSLQTRRHKDDEDPPA